MQVTREDGTDTFHPACEPPPPTRMEKLQAEYLAAVQMGDQPDLEAQIEAEMLELEAKPPRLKDAALAYVSWGWPVFPLRGVRAGCLNVGDPKSKCYRLGLCQCPKEPATPHGFRDATLDATKVARYWDAYPDANIGLPTGVRFDVVDIDVPVGVNTWTGLIAEGKQDYLIPNEAAEVHGHVATASGGHHLYIPPTGWGNHGRILEGIDTRGRGGYVVAPPSRLDAPGRSWSWLVKPSPNIRA